MIPSLFRAELWHPLTIHFPIGLLIVGTLLRILGVAFQRRLLFLDASRLIIFLGTLSAWVAWYTGGIAEEEVNSKLCDPTLTHLHGDYAFYVTLIFSTVAIIDIAAYFGRTRGITSLWSLSSKTANVLLVLICAAGAGLLGYVGHLGAGLTYNQAAGVYVPSPQCTEFE